MAKSQGTIAHLIDEIRTDISNYSVQRSIPDIITFVEDPEWLGLPYHPSNPINLYPMQKIMLKVFYRGTEGNENLQLTEDEIALCKKVGLDTIDRGDFLEKYHSDSTFRELVLVWGRRSGKDFVVSIIATYEAMKLLECPGGDPYQMYEISSANTINILTVANSAPQSNLAFSEIRERIFNSKYFQDKFMKDGITSGAIYLLTPKDKLDNQDYKKRGVPLKKGSIGVIVGHSNSDTLLGMGCIVLILDEVASYKMTGGASSGDRIYTALTPTVKTYVRKVYETTEDGSIALNEFGQKIIKTRRYDGKVVSISSPRGKEGKFYELFKTSPNVSIRLSLRLPTWDVNPTHTRQSLREEEKTMSESEFNMEYGAEFSGSGVENFFTEDQVKSCFMNHPYQFREVGRPGCVYFVHLDPASSSHNYALVIVHKEFFMNSETHKVDFMVVVDHIKFWRPTQEPIDPEEVIEYIIELKRRFHIGMITYDQWATRESILKLRKAGIPNKETRFNQYYKNLIYRQLEDLVNSNRLHIPYENTLYLEMIELQRKFMPMGFRVLRQMDGDGIKSDDIVDALAGACYMAVESQTSKLPQGKMVELGNPGGQDVVWRNMQGGIYGVGNGKQVAKALERRNSWPNYMRR
jgi:phage terminase large subunit-like protein